jgi:hypothetical protein
MTSFTTAMGGIMAAKRAILWLGLTLFLVAACDPGAPRPSGPASSNEAQATYLAIAAQETQAAALVTRQADEAQATIAAATAQAEAQATGTAVAFGHTQTATADALNTQATTSALYIQATREAAAARATAVDMENQARMVEWAAADEARRLANQRAAEEQWVRVSAALWASVALAIPILALAIAYFLYRRSQPWIIERPNQQPIMISNGGHQLLEPARRLTVSQPEPERLPALTDGAAQPLPRLEAGHALVAGETGSGKSTAMRAILVPRPNAVILDPHAAPGDWPGRTVIGGGRDFQAIAEYLAQMDLELNERYSLRAEGMRNFRPLTVATDEMNAIIAEIGKNISDTWRQWLREGRKVGLFFVTSSHSTRVGPLGIKGEGDLLLNFHSVLMLGEVAIEKYGDLVRNMERPAILHTQHGTRPVIIPHIPAGHSTAPPIHTMPAGPRPIETQWGTISPDQARRVLNMEQEGLSRRAIEETVFGHAGGAAYYKVKFILEGATEIGGAGNGRFSGSM